MMLDYIFNQRFDQWKCFFRASFQKRRQFRAHVRSIQTVAIQKLCRADIQVLADLNQPLQADLGFPTLDFADKGGGNIQMLCQPFLGNLFFLSVQCDTLSESLVINGHDVHPSLFYTNGG